MRTLLIAPSFLAIFAIAVFSVGWLITAGGQISPNIGAMPSRASFEAWFETMQMRRSPIQNPAKAAARERVEELGQY